MALNPTYSVGTVSVSAGGTVVTGAGTLWLSAGIQAGDVFELAGLTATILSVANNTTLTLARAWPGATSSASLYEVRYTPDAARVLAWARQVVEMLDSGNLSTLSELQSAGNMLPYFVGPGVAALTPISSVGRDIISQSSPQDIRAALGLTGYAGAGIRIQGVVANVAALPATGNTVGDAYLVGTNLYVWGGAAPWANAGPVSGPAGSDGTQIYPSRSAAVSQVPSLAASVSQIFVRNVNALEIRSRTATADDPLFTTSPQWGVVLRQDVVALQTELQREIRTGRTIWVSGSSPSGSVTTANANLVFTTDGVTSTQAWRTTTAPSPATETDDLKLDGLGQWWRRSWDSRTSATAVSTLSALVTPVQIAITAASGSADRNAATWTVPARYRRITSAIIQAAPPQLGNVNTVLQTADVDTVQAPGGTRTIWRDTSGRVFERYERAGVLSDWIEIPSGTTRTADIQARVSGDTANADAIAALNVVLSNFMLSSPSTQALGRGDAAVVVEMNGTPVQTVSADGRMRLVLDDWSLADLEDRLQIEGGGGGSPVSPDRLGSIDGWNVWETAGLLTFTANFGNGAREYVMRPNEDAWVNGRSQVPVRLLYGDEMGAAGVSLAALSNPRSVSTLDDGTGQAGLNGTVAASPATGIQRAGMGFASLVADFWVSSQAVARWALVRSEAVTGASLAQLRTGQPLANLTRAVTEAERVLPAYQRTALVDTVSIMHGAGDDSPSYGADLLSLMQTLNSSIGARRINLYQPSGTTERADFASAEGTLQAFRDKGPLPVTLVSPTYWCGIASGTIGVFDATSMTMLAELEALAALDRNWMPPLAFYAERVGSVINIDFEVMPGVSLVAPTVGLVVAGATMSSASIVADPVTGRLTRLSINLSGTPAGAVTVRYCRGSGPRFTGNLRDNWSSPSVTGGTLYRYACSFQFEV